MYPASPWSTGERFDDHHYRQPKRCQLPEARCARHKKYVPEQSSTSKEAGTAPDIVPGFALEDLNLNCHCLEGFFSLPTATCR